MEELLLHPASRQQLDRFAAHPSHAIALVAPSGSGKRTIARAISARLLNVNSLEAADDYPYLKVIEPEADKTSIGIEAVRELQHFTSLTLPKQSGQTAWRIIQIFEAQGMGHEAQNALLKLLEEPPAHTVFILTVQSAQQLLPTIRSRLQQINLNRPSKPAIEQFYLDKGYSTADIASAYFLSGGLPGLMSALLSDSEHPLKQTVALARQLLQMNQFERLCLVDGLSKKKPEALQLIFVLQHMAQAAIEQASGKAIAANVSAEKPLRQWHKVLRACYDAEQSYSVSAQAKLTLTHLMLEM